MTLLFLFYNKRFFHVSATEKPWNWFILLLTRKFVKIRFICLFIIILLKSLSGGWSALHLKWDHAVRSLSFLFHSSGRSGYWKWKRTAGFYNTVSHTVKSQQYLLHFDVIVPQNLLSTEHFGPVREKKRRFSDFTFLSFPAALWFRLSYALLPPSGHSAPVEPVW